MGNNQDKEKSNLSVVKPVQSVVIVDRNSQVEKPQDSYVIVKVPSGKGHHEYVREENYAQQSNKIQQSTFKAPPGLLNFTIDDPEGVSRQAEVYTFDYEKYLNHYLPTPQVEKD